MSEEAQRVIRAAERHAGPVDAYLTRDDRLVIVPADAVPIGRYDSTADPAWVAEDMGVVLSAERPAKKSEG